jgi:hypothetical protein
MTASEHRQLMLRALAKVALPAVETLPPSDRADAYEGLAIALRADEPELSTRAETAAISIREAESAQMTFRLSLK